MALYDHLIQLASRTPTTLAAPPHSQTAAVTRPLRASFPDPFKSVRTEGVSHSAPSHTLLAALAPENIARHLRPAFGDVERRRLATDRVLEVEYANLGLARKKRFSVDQLRKLLDEPHTERDAWLAVGTGTAAGAGAETLAPLLAFVGRRLDCEVELRTRASGGKPIKFEDLKIKREGHLTVTVTPEGTFTFEKT